jgi:CheY-like chemotaxis protein
MEGYEVWAYLNGADAINMIRKKTPDLIITDLWMPAMDGFVFIHKVRHELLLNDIPIIIFSAKPSQEFEEKAAALDVHHYIKKPSELETILSTINHLIS